MEVNENETVETLKYCFGEMVVYKDLKKSNFFSALSLPAFLRDWLLKKFEDEDGKELSINYLCIIEGKIV